jgi:hypothetical protein
MTDETAPVPVPVVPMEEAIAAERAFLELEIRTKQAELDLLCNPVAAALMARMLAKQVAHAQIVPVERLDPDAIANIIASVPGVLDEMPPQTRTKACFKCGATFHYPADGGIPSNCPECWWNTTKQPAETKDQRVKRLARERSKRAAERKKAAKGTNRPN